MADCRRFKGVQSILAVVFYLISIGSFNLYAAESDAIIAGAQKEGELITWAVGEIPFAAMVVDRFKKKYPFIRSRQNFGKSSSRTAGRIKSRTDQSAGAW